MHDMVLHYQFGAKILVMRYQLEGTMNNKDKDNRLILEPYIEVPAREKWLFANKAALKKVKQGLKDAAEKRFSEKGGFAPYAEEDVD